MPIKKKVIKRSRPKRTNLGLFSIDMLSQYGVYYPSRTLFITGEIGETTLNKVLSGIELLDKEGELLTIKLSSPGGCMYDGLGIYDALRNCKSRVRIIGYGTIMSMAAIILQAADEGERWLMPNSTVMCHLGSSRIDENHPTQVKRTLVEYDRIGARGFGILAANMGLTLGQFNKKYTFDVYMDAENAISRGIADRVVESY